MKNEVQTSAAHYTQKVTTDYTSLLIYL